MKSALIHGILLAVMLVYGYLMIAGVFGLKYVLDRKDVSVPTVAAAAK